MPDMKIPLRNTYLHVEFVKQQVNEQVDHQLIPGTKEIEQKKAEGGGLPVIDYSRCRNAFKLQAQYKVNSC